MRSGSLARGGVALALILSMGMEPAAARTSGEPLTVDVWLTEAPGLPPRARMSLAAEVEAIWSREGVHIAWVTEPARQPAVRPNVRVLVVQRGVASPGRWPVGGLLRTGPGRSAPLPPAPGVAVTSIVNARHVLAAAGFGPIATPRSDVRLGVVLGRAVAHEIGHYLLGTATHAASGLMRARIVATDFADLDSGNFALDGAARHWLRDRHDAAAADAPAFAYER